MTVLVSWIGIDSRGPGSMYIAADSRISWGDKAIWDFGRKVFGFKAFPDIVGYTGDVLFASQAISEVIEVIDSGAICSSDDNCETRFSLFEKNIISLLNQYPKYASGFEQNEQSIIYCGRNERHDYHCWNLSWSKSKSWTSVKIDLPSKSGIVCVLGSSIAVTEFKALLDKYLRSDISGTSRSIYTCFADLVMQTTDRTVGGAPQLIGLTREGNSKVFGIVHDSKLTVLGVPVESPLHPNVLEWRNENFEICDGRTGKIMEGAQRQPNPLKRQ